jgi:trimethylamine--corrinoid protein Co-methyltransferase
MARASGGRAARHEKRSKALPTYPAPPSGIGGQYNPLRDAEIGQVYTTAIRLLEELGVGEVPAQPRDLFVQVGATFENGCIFLPRSLVEQAIQSAPKSFTLHGRDPGRSIQVAGTSLHFGTGGGDCGTDLGSGQRCLSSLNTA